MLGRVAYLQVEFTLALRRRLVLRLDQAPRYQLNDVALDASWRRLNDAFEAARRSADLPEELDLHSLRHSYVTHLIEFGYPEKFVQDQVGHAYASTTAIYSHVSDEYRNRLLLSSLQARLGDLWEQET